MKNKLKAVREKVGMTAVEVGKMVGLSKTQMSFIENGQLLPNKTTTEMLCKLYKKNVSDLFSENELITYQKQTRKKATQEEKTVEFENLLRHKLKLSILVGLNLFKLTKKLYAKEKQNQKPNIWQKLLKKFQKQKEEKNG